jgi:NADH-quinone oxidoreductase subunit F
MPELVLTKHCNVPDIEHLDVYEQHGGYTALRRALLEMQPAGIVDTVVKANLRGRGGAGFPAGRKWSMLPTDRSIERYLLCNADEGTPGAFNNRFLMECNPHQLIEGCMVGSYAIGAQRAFILVRGEYKLALQRIEAAIDEAYRKGYLGRNILGTGYSLDLLVHRGAGSYEVGEESALMECLEGSRGMPRQRPPFPAMRGLYGKPTVINNVETLCNVPHIVNNGAEWFLGIGSPSCPGTKVYSMSGNVRNPGNYEAPMGTTFRELIAMAGGMQDPSHPLKVLMLGAEAPIVPAALQDTPADIDSMIKIGSFLGAAPVIVLDDRQCVVDFTLRATRFFAHESCGKCTPCREGCPWMTRVLERIETGLGTMADIDLLAGICANIAGKSLCALGEFATGPVLSSIKYFREEYERHIAGYACHLGTVTVPVREQAVAGALLH